MGVDCTIRFPAGSVPAWDSVKSRLTRIGEAAPLRMIDGLPAFPDETPDEGWSELRIGFASGMVTLRKGAESLTCVVWGNADSTLFAARDLLAWACAAAGSGVIVTPSGEVPAPEFARLSGISPA